MYNGVEGIDYVECPICGKQGIRIYKHIKVKHNLSVEEFSRLYPGKQTTAENLKTQIQRNTKVSLNTVEVVEKRNKFWNSVEGKEIAARNGAKAWDNPEWVNARNKKVSDRMKELWKDDNFKSSQKEKIKVATNTDRVKELHHKRLVKQWKDANYRKHITECVNNQFDEGKLGVLKEYIDNKGEKVEFRSSWELSVHNILNTIGVEHYYEHKKFKKWFPEENKYLIYRPDFYVPEYDVYLEVKPDNLQNEELNLMKRQMVLDEGCNIYYVGDNEYYDIDSIKEKLGIN